MEFNSYVPQLGMFKGMLCLDCWAANPDDVEVITCSPSVRVS